MITLRVQLHRNNSFRLRTESNISIDSDAQIAIGFHGLLSLVAHSHPLRETKTESSRNCKMIYHSAEILAARKLHRNKRCRLQTFQLNIYRAQSCQASADCLHSSPFKTLRASSKRNPAATAVNSRNSMQRNIGIEIIHSDNKHFNRLT